MKNAVFCDIDGTIADCDHRRAYLDGTKAGSRKFHREMGDDTPKRDVINVFHALQEGGLDRKGLIGVLVSARSERDRKQTELWLTFAEVRYARLVMRPMSQADWDDRLVKLNMLSRLRADGLDPAIVLDDRDGVVAMWRAEGVTCLQVAPGAF